MPSKHRCHVTLSVDINKLDKVIAIVEHLNGAANITGASRLIDLALSYLISAAETTSRDQSFRLRYSATLQEACLTALRYNFSLNQGTRKFLEKLDLLPKESPTEQLPLWPVERVLADPYDKASMEQATKVIETFNIDAREDNMELAERIAKGGSIQKMRKVDKDPTESLVRDKGRAYWEAVRLSGQINDPSLRNGDVVEAVLAVYGIDLGELL